MVAHYESREEWQEFHDHTLSELGPEGALETSIATRIAETLWRLRRVPAAETTLINRVAFRTVEQATSNALYRIEDPEDFIPVMEQRNLEAMIESPPPPPAALPGERELNSIVRYEGHLNRELRHAFRDLDALRRRRLDDSPEQARLGIDIRGLAERIANM